MNGTYNSMNQKSICVFVHYSALTYIPYYVEVYVKELCLYFDEILVVANKREIKNAAIFDNLPVRIQLEKNEGYDFGMFYKGYKTLDIQNYHTLACINDSNALFGSLKPIFDWAASKPELDFWGVIDSDIDSEPAKNINHYHICSHFLVFNKRAIDLLDNFFHTLNINEIFSEKNIKKLKLRVIAEWEIGLTQFFSKQDINLETYFSYKPFAEYGSKKTNYSVMLDYYEESIKLGLPLLKKKIITSFKPRDYLGIYNPWVFLIYKHGTLTNLGKIVRNLRMIKINHAFSKISTFLK
ncbi:MAG: hypothetical protein ACRCVT_08425 [Leadbetterella sp.]